MQNANDRSLNFDFNGYGWLPEYQEPISPEGSAIQEIKEEEENILCSQENILKQ